MSNSSLTADQWLLGLLGNMVANPLIDIIYQQILFFWHNSPHRARASSFLKFLDHTQWCTAVGRIHSGRIISSLQRALPDNTQHSQQTNVNAPNGIQTHNLSRWSATNLLLRPRSHWDWHSITWKVFI